MEQIKDFRGDLENSEELGGADKRFPEGILKNSVKQIENSPKLPVEKSVNGGFSNTLEKGTLSPIKACPGFARCSTNLVAGLSTPGSRKEAAISGPSWVGIAELVEQPHLPSYLLLRGL